MGNQSRIATSPGLVAGLLVAMTALLASSCAAAPVVDVTLTDPLGLKGQAVYAQLAIFEGDCPSPETLAFGRIGMAIEVQTVAVTDDFGEIGKLKKAKFGFSALLRTADCSVIAMGCTPVNLETHRHITIEVDAVNPPSGACDTAAGQSCTGGVCLLSALQAEGKDNADGGAAD
jgi:hypothetical protein